MTDRGDSPVDLVNLLDGEGYLMRPVMRGMCKYESLKNGDLDLCDVARMNEALDIDEENRARIHEWQARQNGR